MDRRQYDLAFDKQFDNMKYSEALEVVGAMKYAGIPKSRYLEMLIYFERGEFEKIRNSLKGKRIDNVEERECYLVSLIELRQYDEFESYYNELGRYIIRIEGREYETKQVKRLPKCKKPVGLGEKRQTFAPSFSSL